MIRKTLAALFAAATLSLTAPAISNAVTPEGSLPGEQQQDSGTVYIVVVETPHGIHRFGVYRNHQEAHNVARTLHAQGRAARVVTESW